MQKKGEEFFEKANDIKKTSDRGRQISKKNSERKKEDGDGKTGKEKKKDSVRGRERKNAIDRYKKTEVY